MEQEDKYKFWTGIAEKMAHSGYMVPQLPPHITLDRDPKPILISAYQYCLSRIGKEDQFKYTPEMDMVSSWLKDNHNTGLLLFGNCGTGKTFLARHVLPLIIKAAMNKMIDYFDMTYASRHTDEVLQSHLLILDDIGCEQKFNDFGTIRDTLNEVVDSAEKKGKLLILTANLTGDEIKQLYGERTFDRIRSLCTQIPFTGRSFRANLH